MDVIDAYRGLDRGHVAILLSMLQTHIFFIGESTAHAPQRSSGSSHDSHVCGKERAQGGKPGHRLERRSGTARKFGANTALVVYADRTIRLSSEVSPCSRPRITAEVEDVNTRRCGTSEDGTRAVPRGLEGDASYGHGTTEADGPFVRAATVAAAGGGRRAALLSDDAGGGGERNEREGEKKLHGC